MQKILKNKGILFLLLIIVIAGFWYLNKTENNNIEKSLGAISSSEFKNDFLEKSIVNYLERQNQFSWKTQSNSFSLCTIENLYPEKELFPLYIWAYCGEYILKNEKIKTISGSSGPVKINYPNELSFYDLNKFSHEAPGDGSNYSRDIEKIFPKNIWDKILNFDRKSIIEKGKTFALQNILNWKSIKNAIENCEVTEIFQAHNKDVNAELKNGKKIKAIEANLGDIINIANDSKSKCGDILIGIE